MQEGTTQCLQYLYFNTMFGIPVSRITFTEQIVVLLCFLIPFASLFISLKTRLYAVPMMVAGDDIDGTAQLRKWFLFVSAWTLLAIFCLEMLNMASLTVDCLTAGALPF